MFKLLKLSLFGAGTYYCYRKVTECETNITVNSVNTKSCLYGKLDRHTVTTDKGDYVLQNKLKSFDFGPMLKLNSYEYSPSIQLSNGYTYHVTTYGLHYPQLHLYRTIVSNNGTPCTYGDHCTEKPSLLSSLLSKFH